MFSKEIEDLLKGDNFEILKILSQYNPERFKQDVHALSDKGYSFFITLLKDNHDVNYVKSLLELCESFGYNFVEAKSEYHEDHSYKLLSPKNKKTSYNYGLPDISIANEKNLSFTPEYIFAFSHAENDEITAFLTEKMGKDRMLELEKDGWPILEYSYRKKLFKTIKLLSDYGLDYDNPPSGVSILQIAENDIQLIDTFWKIKNEKEQSISEFMNEGQFDQFIFLFTKKLKDIHVKKSDYTPSIIKTVEEKKDLLSKEQKEQLLIKSLVCLDDRVAKYLMKLLNLKQKSLEANTFILKNLDNLNTHDFLYWVVENEKFLFTKIEEERNPKNNIYGVDKIIYKLADLSIHLFSEYASDKNKKVINNTFTERFKTIFQDDNILLEEFDNGMTLFEKIALKPLSKGNLFAFLNLKPKKSLDMKNSMFKNLSLEQFEDITNGKTILSNDQKQEIKELLNKTWLKESDDGRTFLDRCDVPQVVLKNTFIFNKFFMEDNFIFSNDEKMKIFKELVEYTRDSYIFDQSLQSWSEKSDETNNYRLLKDLYIILSNDPETKWSKLQLDEKTLKKLQNKEFLYELKARQLSEELASDLTGDKVNKSNKKVKL